MDEDPKTSLRECKSDHVRSRKMEPSSRRRRSGGGKQKVITTDTRKQKSASQGTENVARRPTTRRQGSDKDLSKRGKSRKSLAQKQDERQLSQSVHNSTRPRRRPSLTRPRSVRQLSTKDTPSISGNDSPSIHNTAMDRSSRRKERIRKSVSSTQKVAASWVNEVDKVGSLRGSSSSSLSSPSCLQDKKYQERQQSSQVLLAPTLEPIESESEIDEIRPSTATPASKTPATLTSATPKSPPQEEVFIPSQAKQKSPEIRKERPPMLRPPSLRDFATEDDQTQDDGSEGSDSDSSEPSTSSRSDVGKTIKSFNLSMNSNNDSFTGTNMMKSYVGLPTAQEGKQVFSCTSSKIALGLKSLGASHLNYASQSEASTLEGSDHQSEVSESEFDQVRVPEDQERQEVSPQITSKSGGPSDLFGASKASSIDLNTLHSSTNSSNNSTFNSNNNSCNAEMAGRSGFSQKRQNSNRSLTKSKSGKSSRNLVRASSQKSLSRDETNDKVDRRSTASLLKKAKSVKKLNAGSDTASRVDRMLKYAESWRDLSNRAAEVKATSRQEAVKLSREVY